MMRLLRRGAQGGVTLIETLAVVAISSIIMVPLLGWGLVAIQEQEAVLHRNTDGASIGLLRTYYVRDVASALAADVGTDAEGTDCSGGEGAASSPGQTLLRLVGEEDTSIVYNETTSSGGTGLSVWRRECDGSTLMSTVELVDRVAAGNTQVTCSARTGAPEPDCGRIHFRLVTTETETVAMSATVRTGQAASAPPSGPVYVSPDVVIIVSPTTVFRGETVTFNASGTTDPTGRTLTHHWDFGDGTTSDQAEATHTYNNLGEFTAVYTATNEDGTPASDYARITVENRPPTAAISAPPNGLTTTRCVDVTFAGSGSDDAGDAPFGGTVVEYQWDYGDGDSSTQISAAPHTHQFRTLSPGGTTVQLVVVDNDGGGSIAATRSVTVNNRPPTAAITADGGPGPITGLVSKDVAFASTVSDPDTCATSNEVLSYEWDFGDGDTLSCLETDTDCTNPTHTYSTAEPVTATLTVTDTGGADVGSNAIQVDLNTKPEAQYTLHYTSWRAGQPLPAEWITNTSFDPDGDPLTAAWTFPNGTPASASGSSPPPSGDWDPPSVTFTHNVGSADTFISTGYNIELTTTDSQGAYHTRTQTITVTGAPYPGNFRRTGSGCERSNWLGCQERYINFAWDAVPNVDLYQLQLNSLTFACGSGGTRTYTGTSAHFDGLDDELWTCWYDAFIRSKDSVTQKWGPWSPVLNTNSG